MPLILAIESDRKQATRIAAIARDRLKAEIIVAESAESALKTLAARTPDLLLTPQLMSSKDEAALDERLRELDAAGSHVQTLMIPVLSASGRRTGKKGGLLNRLRRGKSQQPAAEDGCDPSVFAAQIAEYLERAADERATAAKRMDDDREDAESDARSASAVPVASDSGSWPAEFDEQLPPMDPLEMAAALTSRPVATVATMEEIHHPQEPETIEPEALARIVELSPVADIVDTPPLPVIAEHDELEPQPDRADRWTQTEGADGIDVLAFLDAMTEREAAAKTEAKAKPEADPDDPWEILDLDDLPAIAVPAAEPEFDDAPAARVPAKRAARGVEAPTKSAPIAPKAPPTRTAQPAPMANQAQLDQPVDQADAAARDLFMEFVTFDELCVVDVPLASLGEFAAQADGAGVPEPTPLNLDGIREIDEPRTETARARQKTPASLPPVAVADPDPAPAEVAAPAAPQAHGKSGKKRAKDSKPAQDEWGFFDPVQCGFAALLAKLDSTATDKEESEEKKQKVLR